jgi:hypothetical protein
MFFAEIHIEKAFRREDIHGQAAVPQSDSQL